jgi:DNA invertase Pin-like site-specific DNA recombinase
MTEKTKTAATYIRVSLPADHPDSAAQIEWQRKTIAAFIGARNIRIVAEFIDYGLASEDHFLFPQYQLMADYLKKEKPDCVIIASLEQAVNEGIDLAEMIAMSNQAGVECLTASIDKMP